VALVLVALPGCGGSPPTAPALTAATPAPTAAGGVTVGSLAVDPAGGALLAGTDRGLFRVPAEGGEPERVTGELTTRDGSGEVSAGVVVAFAGPGDLLASGHPDRSGSALPQNLGLMRSADGGATWKPVSELGKGDFHVLEAAGDRVVAVGADRPEIRVSADAGRSFEDRTPPAPPLDVVFAPGRPEQMVAATEDALYTSEDDGRSWRLRDPTPGGRLAWAATGDVYRAGADGVVQTSGDGGTSWMRRSSLGAPVLELAAGPDALYAALAGGEIRRSTDRGATWQRFATVG
jgi:hypothetical protein